MRGMFGLVGLLVTVAVIAVIFVKMEAPVATQGRKAQDQAQQISGHGDDGRAMTDSFKTEPQEQGGKLKALLVTEVTSGGAADDYYGLKKGDVVTSIEMPHLGWQKISDSLTNDATMSKINIQEAYQAAMHIVVMRNGKQITLPPLANSTASPAPAVTGSAPTPSTPAQSPPATPAAPRNVYDQINNITKSIPGQ
jgi:hypothetical protein